MARREYLRWCTPAARAVLLLLMYCSAHMIGVHAATCRVARPNELLFCNEVAYPIGLYSDEDILSKDQLAQQMYNLNYGDFVKKGEPCLKSYKAMLCTTNMPVCDDDGVALKPCKSVCTDFYDTCLGDTHPGAFDDKQGKDAMAKFFGGGKAGEGADDPLYPMAKKSLKDIACAVCKTHPDGHEALKGKEPLQDEEEYPERPTLWDEYIDAIGKYCESQGDKCAKSNETESEPEPSMDIPTDYAKEGLKTATRAWCAAGALPPIEDIMINSLYHGSQQVCVLETARSCRKRYKMPAHELRDPGFGDLKETDELILAAHKYITPPLAPPDPEAEAERTAKAASKMEPPGDRASVPWDMQYVPEVLKDTAQWFCASQPKLPEINELERQQSKFYHACLKQKKCAGNPAATPPENTLRLAADVFGKMQNIGAELKKAGVAGPAGGGGGGAVPKKQKKCIACIILQVVAKILLAVGIALKIAGIVLQCIGLATPGEDMETSGDWMIKGSLKANIVLMLAGLEVDEVVGGVDRELDMGGTFQFEPNLYLQLPQEMWPAFVGVDRLPPPAPINGDPDLCNWEDYARKPECTDATVCGRSDICPYQALSLPPPPQPKKKKKKADPSLVDPTPSCDDGL